MKKKYIIKKNGKIKHALRKLNRNAKEKLESVKKMSSVNYQILDLKLLHHIQR